MRILYVIGGYGNEHLGGEIHRELAREITARGHEYHIFALAHARYREGLPRDVVEDEVPVHLFTAAGRPGRDAVNTLARPFLRFPWFIPALVGLARFLRGRPLYDVIIAESAFPMGAIADLATRSRPQPLLISVSGGDCIRNDQVNYGYARYRLPRALLAAAFHRSALVRAVSPPGAENARALGCPAGKIAILQRNIGRVCFLPMEVGREVYRHEARRRVQERFNLPGGSLITTVGRLLPIKGFDQLLRALPAVRAEFPGAQVLHVGPNRRDERLGDYRVHLERLAATLGVSSAVSFAGALPHAEVRDCLAGADAVAIPSAEEGGNKIVMEAAAAGTPFVATTATGTSRWARPFRCGLEVAPGDPEALAKGLLSVLRSPDEANAMGRRGQDFARAFRPEVVAEHLLRLCLSAARGEPPPEALRTGDLAGARGA